MSADRHADNRDAKRAKRKTDTAMRGNRSVRLLARIVSAKAQEARDNRAAKYAPDNGG